MIFDDPDEQSDFEREISALRCGVCDGVATDHWYSVEALTREDEGMNTRLQVVKICSAECETKFRRLYAQPTIALHVLLQSMMGGEN